MTFTVLKFKDHTIFFLYWILNLKNRICTSKYQDTLKNILQRNRKAEEAIISCSFFKREKVVQVNQ